MKICLIFRLSWYLDLMVQMHHWQHLLNHNTVILGLPLESSSRTAVGTKIHGYTQAPYIKWCSTLGPPYLPVSHLLIQLQIKFFTFSWLNPRMYNQRRFNLGIGGQTVFGNSCTFILKLQLEVRMWKLRHLGLGNEILLLPHLQHNLKFNHRGCLLFASFADVICISETLTWT